MGAVRRNTAKKANLQGRQDKKHSLSADGAFGFRCVTLRNSVIFAKIGNKNIANCLNKSERAYPFAQKSVDYGAKDG